MPNLKHRIVRGKLVRPKKRPYGKVFAVVFYGFIIIITPMSACVMQDHDGNNLLAIPSFVHEIEGLPIADNYEIREDLNVAFDTPDGRIIDVHLERNGISEENQADEIAKVEKFYQETLPTLGWQKVTWKEATYAFFEREDESLKLEILPRDRTMMLKFSLRPKGD